MSKRKGSSWLKLNAVARFLSIARRNKKSVGKFGTGIVLPSTDNDDEVSGSPCEEDGVKSKTVKGMGFGNIFQGGAIKLKSTNEQSPDNKVHAELISNFFQSPAMLLHYLINLSLYFLFPLQCFRGFEIMLVFLFFSGS